MENTTEFKKAAIDWVLTHGQSMTQYTGGALADLAVNGVDYEASDMPDFRRVAVDSGDSFHDATYAEAFACTVYPLNSPHRGEEFRYDGHEFFVSDDDMKRILIGHVIAGVLAAAETGDKGWKARADQRDIERIRRNAEAVAAREERARSQKGKGQ